MNNIKIITDNCCDLPDNYVQENNLKMIPIYYRFEGENIEYGDEIKLTSKEFFKKMKDGMTPKTMSCNLFKIKEEFERELEKNNDIIYISISSGLSSNYYNVLFAANELKEKYPDNNIKVIDSLNGSMSEGLIVLKAIDLVNKEYKFDDIVNYIEQNKLKYGIEFFVNDLKYLVNGGRLKTRTAILANTLNIKPVITLDESGKAIEIARMHGEKKALKLLLERLQKNLDLKEENISIVHSDYEEGAMKLKEKLEQLKILKKCIISEIGPTIASHIGNGNLGFAYKKTK